MIKIVIIDIRNVIFALHGPVVQLDRISDFGSEGWGFESSLGHIKKRLNFEPFFIFCFLKNLL